MPGKERTREHTKRDVESVKQNRKKADSQCYRITFRNLFTCWQQYQLAEGKRKKSRRIGCSGSRCNVKNNHSSVMFGPERTLPETYKRRASVSGCGGNCRSMKMPLSKANGLVYTSSSSHSSGVSSSLGGSFRGMQLRRISGCYECHMVVDPISRILRDSSLRATICSCPDCGEIFAKPESLDLHQAIRHAVLIN